MDMRSLEEQVRKCVDLVEKFPEKLQPTILAEAMRIRLNGEIAILRPTRRAKRFLTRTDDSVQSRRQNSGPRDKILELKNGGFFDEAKTDLEVMEELKVRGFHYSRGSVAARLLELARDKEVNRFKEPNGKKVGYKYQNPLN